MSTAFAAALPTPLTTATVPPSKPLLTTATRRLVLTGFMGVGKSTVGALLAERLGWSFLDLDRSIEDRTGATVPELFEREGERGFRRLESTALAAALRRTETILALGGGAPETLTNRLLLEQTPGTVVFFLDAPFPTLFDRCMLQNLPRPVLADPAVAQLRFAERQPLYRRLARHTVNTAELDPASVADAILAVLTPGKDSL